MTRFRVIVGHGYDDGTEDADTVEVVEGCLIFTDADGVSAIYSPDRWRLVIRESDGKAVA